MRIASSAMVLVAAAVINSLIAIAANTTTIIVFATAVIIVIATCHRTCADSHRRPSRGRNLLIFLMMPLHVLDLLFGELGPKLSH